MGSWDSPGGWDAPWLQPPGSGAYSCGRSTRGYWADTYLPGDPTLRFLESRLAATHGLPHHLSRRPVPPFDPPEHAALGLQLHADRRHADGRTRMILRVGLQATERHGGRRAAMRLGVVLHLPPAPDGSLDPETLGTAGALLEALAEIRDFEDRFHLGLSGRTGGWVLGPEDFRHGPLTVLLERLAAGETVGPVPSFPALDPASAVRSAVGRLAGADDPSAPLGSRGVLLITAAPLDGGPALDAAVHGSAVAGVPVSVVGVEKRVSAAELERLALLGQGRLRLLDTGKRAKEVAQEELEAASRTAARAVRLNIRLAPGVDLVDVLGSRRLDAGPRARAGLTVDHTFKYVESPPSLAVRAERPERRQGRFDVQVDTLVSLGDVTLEGASSVEVDVRSGSVTDLRLALPPETHLLSLSGPSVREHEVEEGAAGSTVTVEFTQEMEGQFRVELGWERILGEGEERVPVPRVAVSGAEVEQGRLAVEALSAVEVQPAEVTGLTVLDVAELPRRLVLKTAHPILHAFKYVGSDPRLVLEVTRHRVVEVQEAAIDSARYRTLYTRDGTSVTRARFMVRNSREQFLRIRLPEGSEIWSAFVDGRPAKPAQAEGSWYLIQIIHRTREFPVEVIYRSPASPIEGLGVVRGTLPRPKILVTHSRWDVFVPEDVRYGEPRGTMDPLIAGEPVGAEQMAPAAVEEGGEVEPLRLVVPTAGRHFAFEKLYANQGEKEVGFEIPYAAGYGASLGRGGALLGILLLWAGAGLAVTGRRLLGAALVLAGAFVVAVPAWRYGVSPWPVLIVTSLVSAAIVAAFVARRRSEGRKKLF